MVPGQTLILIDSDTRRRAALSHSLSLRQIHVEPFESTAELWQGWSGNGTILVHDQGATVRDLTEFIARNGQWYPVIAFAEAPKASQIVEAILAGAIDFLAWPFDADDLLTTLEQIKDRVNGIGEARMREAMARGRIENLTEREREVLGWVASGLSNRKIGEKLSISPRTVEIHRANMLTKLGADHTSQAIRIAIEAELTH